MHIAFIEDTKLYGGTQLWVMDAIDFFLAQGWEVTVITPTNSWIEKECLKISRKMNLATYDYEGITTQTKKYVNLWGNSLRNSDVAVCTVHPPRKNFHCSLFAMRCIKELGLQVQLVTKTGTIVPSYKRAYYLPDQIMNSRIIAITKTIYQYLMSKYVIPEEKIHLLYQGIDLEYFTRRETEKESSLKERLSGFTPIIGCIGSLEQRKGQDYLLHALDIVRTKFFPKIHLLLVGDGPDEKQLKEKVKELGLQSNVTFIPFTRKMEEIFKNCDILTLPSISKEGLPNVILEAFSMNIPVIASDIGGINEVVKNKYTGYLVEPKNIENLVSAIYNIWQNQESYIQMGKNARRLVMDQHNRKIQLTKFEVFFKRLLNSNTIN